MVLKDAGARGFYMPCSDGVSLVAAVNGGSISFDLLMQTLAVKWLQHADDMMITCLVDDEMMMRKGLS